VEFQLLISQVDFPPQISAILHATPLVSGVAIYLMRIMKLEAEPS
jgi:hypothetical protein